MKHRQRKRVGYRLVCLGAIVMMLTGATALAQDMNRAVAEGAALTEEHIGQGGERGGRLDGMVAIGAGLAIGLAALATGMAQARIGAAGVGAIAENPKRIGMIIMLVAIPETVAILGFVIAYLIIS